MTTPIDPAQLITAIFVLLTVTGVTAALAYKKGRQILADITDIFVNSNAAVQNNSLTPAEATAIINDLKDIAGLVGKVTVVGTPTVAPAPSGTNTTTSTVTQS